VSPKRTSPITTHVLDTARGKPAVGVAVILEIGGLNDWTELARGVTDADGRIGDLLPGNTTLPAGIYRLSFATGAYFRGLGVRGFYPEVRIVVQIDEPAQHYHIPLLISPYGYSTYRGS
jgi:5-hydroxyisourate hydrolase